MLHDHLPRRFDAPRASIALPAFLPDATKGVVRTLDGADLATSGIEAVCVNAYHLQRAPGASVVEAAGGIHAFMGWSGLVMSDSGGFQIYSLLRADPGAGSVGPKGFVYRTSGTRDKKRLDAEKAVRTQLAIGADIAVCLDQCTHPDDSPAVQRASVERTVAWARRGKAVRDEHADRTGRATPLFAVIQGGSDEELRRECAARLVEIGFDGYGFGGWPVDDSGALVPTVALVASLVPRGAPLWGLGIGKPANLVAAARAGYSIFDCVLPTRDGRQGRLLVLPELGSAAAGPFDYHYATDERHRRDPRPVDPGCGCACCARHSRGYLHHLFAMREPLGARLATIHNLAAYARVIAALRAERAGA